MAETDSDRTVAPKRAPAKPTPRVAPAPTPGAPKRRRGVLVGSGLAAAVLVAVGAVVATGGGGEEGGGGTAAPASAPAQTVSLSNAGLALTLPAEYSERPEPGVPGLDGDPVAAASDAGEVVEADLVPGRADPSLLPGPLLDRLRGGRPKPATVQLAGAKAYRYDGLRAKNAGGPLHMYAVLTSGGVATIACAGVDRAACGSIARTLELRAVDAVDAGPSRSYGKVLDTTFAALDKRIRTLSKSQRDATTITAQAAVLDRFAGAYQQARSSLEVSRLNPVDSGLNVKLTSSFQAVAKACKQIGSALRRSDDGALAKARAALRRAQAKLRDATRTLTRAGYRDGPPATPVSEIVATPEPTTAPAAPPTAPTVPDTSSPPSSGGSTGEGTTIID